MYVLNNMMDMLYITKRKNSLIVSCSYLSYMIGEQNNFRSRDSYYIYRNERTGLLLLFLKVELKLICLFIYGDLGLKWPRLLIEFSICIRLPRSLKYFARAFEIRSTI